MKGQTLLSLLLVGEIGTSALGADETPHKSAVTRNTVQISGAEIAYTATVAENTISDKSGAPGAAVVTIAYTRDDAPDAAQRPVSVAFNGGPGASSSPLHLNAMGPMIRASDQSKSPGAAQFYREYLQPPGRDGPGLHQSSLHGIQPPAAGHQFQAVGQL